MFVCLFQPWTTSMNYAFAFVCSTNICMLVHYIKRVWLCYSGLLDNEGIGLVLVIQTFHPPTLSVLYRLICLPNLFIIHYFSVKYIYIYSVAIYMKQHHITTTLHALLLYCNYGWYIIMYIPLCLSTFITYLWSSLHIWVLLIIIPSSSILTIQFSHINIHVTKMFYIFILVCRSSITMIHL